MPPAIAPPPAPTAAPTGPPTTAPVTAPVVAPAATPLWAWAIGTLSIVTANAPIKTFFMVVLLVSEHRKPARRPSVPRELPLFPASAIKPGRLTRRAARGSRPDSARRNHCAAPLSRSSGEDV